MRNPNHFPASQERDNESELQEEIDEAMSEIRPEKIGHRLISVAKNIVEGFAAKPMLDRISQLSNSDNLRDKAKLKQYQSGEGRIDLSNDRILEALLDSYDSFNEERLKSLLAKGVEPSRILKNQHLQQLSISKLENMLTPPPDGEPSPMTEAATKKEATAASYNKLMWSFFDQVTADEKTREQIIANSDKKGIAKHGDDICDELLNNSPFSGREIFREPEQVELAKYKINILKRLGYEYFSDDDQGEKERKASNIFGSENLGHKYKTLGEFGFLNQDAVSTLYHVKAQLMKRYASGDSSVIAGYHKLPPFIRNSYSEKRYVQNFFQIPHELEPDKDDRAAQYWRSQDQKNGFDTMAFIASVSTNNESSVSCLDEGQISDNFFMPDRGPTSHIMNLCDASAPYSRPEYGDDERGILTILANNAERIPNANAKGLVKNWAKLQDYDAEKAYLEYVSRGDTRFKRNNPATGELEDISLFDENGDPTDAFYDFDAISAYAPKRFLSRLDENWQKHFSGDELYGLDFLDSHTSLDRFSSKSIFRDCPTKDFLEIIRDKPETVEQILRFQDESRSSSQFLKDAIGIANKDALDACFDDNGPTPEFYRRALEASPLDSINYIWEQIFIRENAINIDAPTANLCGLWADGCNSLPGFVTRRETYIDENGNKLRRPWTENIPKYFDENGAKPEFWLETLKERNLVFLRQTELEHGSEFSFDAPTRHCYELLATLGSADYPSFFTQPDEIYIDENGNEQRRSWIEDIPKYFDENGAKLEFISDCLRAKQFRTIERVNFDPNKYTNLDDFTRQFITSVGTNTETTMPLDKSNIIFALTKFITKDAVDWNKASKHEQEIREAFSENATKDMALRSLRKAYEGYLFSKDTSEFPIGLKALSDYMHSKGGAGPLTQIEAFLDFAGALGEANDGGCKELTSKLEKKMQQYRWSNQEKTNFYAISAEVLQASPDLYKELASLLENIPNQEDFSKFTTDIYPLFRAKLALLRQYDYSGDRVGHGYSTAYYNPDDIEKVKEQLHGAIGVLNLGQDSPSRRQQGMEIIRKNMLKDITELFKDKLNISEGAIPNEFYKNDVRVIQDMTLYLSFINNPDSYKKNLISLYLALLLDKNGGWNKLRNGETVPVEKLLDITPPEIEAIQNAFEMSRKNNPVNHENTRIDTDDPDRLRAFQTALQQQASSTRTGSIITVDEHLRNLAANADELRDPDALSEIDRQRAEMLEQYSARQIRTVSSKLWGRISGKNIPLNDEESIIADKLTGILASQNIELTPENIVAYLQRGFNAIEASNKIQQILEESHVTDAINDFQRILTPPDEIIKIFNDKLEQDFQPLSGAMAIGSDLNYLENLLNKYEDRLTKEEMDAAQEYIGSIRTKMAELESLSGEITKKLETIAKDLDGVAGSDGLKSIIENIANIAKGGDSEQILTTTFTNDFVIILENMRACLSAYTKGCNNDTNLSFAEGYRFYLYTSNEMWAGSSNSVSDEIVYFIPGEKDGNKSMDFVMDRIYGQKNKDVFDNHVKTMVQKASELKKQFPETPIRVFIPDSTMQSCCVSVTAEDVATRIGLPEGATAEAVTEKTFTVPETSFGDHYIEFGDNGRTPGPRPVSGIEIIL